MDAEGAELLAKQLEVALAVEGVKASENCVQAAIASLLRIENWKTLQREASKQPITLTYGNDPSESVYEVLVHAVMTLADKVLPAVHPSQLANMLDTGEELPALPLYITHAQEDPSQLRIHFNGVNTDHNQGLLGEACTLTSRDPRNLGRMLASVLCREIYLADESIEAFAYAAIEHNPATGEDELFEDDADDEREISPHCRATNEIAPYATNLRLPVPDKDFPAMRMGGIRALRRPRTDVLRDRRRRTNIVARRNHPPNSVEHKPARRHLWRARPASDRGRAGGHRPVRHNSMARGSFHEGVSGDSNSEILCVRKKRGTTGKD